MKINLVELDHQKEAMEALLNAMPNVIKKEGIYSNPLLENAYNENKFIDIKMETGTGKTYVYTRAMLELNRLYGLFKFIIVVPSLAIKEGTKNFIIADYAKQHFSRFFPNKRIDLQLINAGDFSTKKGKRKNFPASIMQFCMSTTNEQNTIQCLLISDKGFLDKSNSALFKDDYDQTLNGYNCPINAIRDTRPIVIIDEPHRFKKDGQTYKNIIDKIHPQLIIRFGATFPDISIGRGANKIIKKDYYRDVPQYNLNAVDAFNKDLVKGVSVQFPSISEEQLNVYKIKSVTKDKLVLSKDGKDWEIAVGEDLSDVGGGFHGDVTYEGNGKLSNDLELKVGMELCEGIYTNSYQEALIQQALDAHFRTEIKNFYRDGYKVKTNTLFFIDSVSSYRDENGWLKVTFEKLLKNKLEALLKEYSSGEYHDFLNATKNNITLSHGGYFAKDWGEPDESAIKEEMEDILHKERTLPFKKENGEWNIRRFFFSKWTLREGWDNPNVFTICKLRSSGSENSKIQEVGRGLRLPVDEMGNRLEDDWRLNFIIGWNEREFAQKLVNDINSDTEIKLDKVHLSDEMIKIICNTRKLDEETVLEQLDEENIIKRNNDFKDGGFDRLLELYPELTQSHLKSGKVTAPDKPKKHKIKLNRANWEKIKDLWLEISKRYMVYFERLDKNEIIKLLTDVLNTEGIFDKNEDIKTTILKTKKSDDQKEVLLETHYDTVNNISGMGKIPYNEFAVKLAKQTKIPIQIIHKCLWEKLSNIKDLSKEDINSLLNYNTLQKINESWQEKFTETFATKYHYDSLNFKVNTSVLKNGEFVDELEQGMIGKYLANDVEIDNRNLYEKQTAYDSEDPEHLIEKIITPEKIKVFGKIPRRSIKVPTYTGGSSSPDFIFATEKDGKIDLTLLIETKSNDMRMSEQIAVNAQEKLFDNISNVEWTLIKKADEVMNLLKNL